MQASILIKMLINLLQTETKKNALKTQKYLIAFSLTKIDNEWRFP